MYYKSTLLVIIYFLSLINDPKSLKLNCNYMHTCISLFPSHKSQNAIQFK